MTYNRTIALILLVVFATLTGSWMVQKEFTLKIEELRTRQSEIEGRNMIYNDIVDCLRNCKALLFQAPMSSANPEMFRNYLRLVRKRFGKILRAFRVLERGGEYERVVSLNLPDHSVFQQHFRLEKGMRIPLQLSPTPQLNLLRTKIDRLERLVGDFLGTHPDREGEMKVSTEFRHRLATTIKELDAIYRRLIENVNQLLYRDQTEAREIKERMDALLEWQHRIQLAAIVFLMLMILILGVLAIRNLSRLNRALSRRLYTDDLSGLPSRAALEERGIAPLEGLLLVDILDFNEINDLYGMQTGDTVLRQVARRLRTLGDSRQVFHIGGDTFALVWEMEGRERREIAAEAERILRTLERESYEGKGVMFRLHFLGGIGRGEHALDEAMIALDEAKQRNVSLVIYDDRKRDFLQRIQRTRSMQHLIHEAILRDRIVPFVQPIFDREGKIVSYELLMRIEIGPGEYILPDFEVAIRSRMYGSLSRTMMRKSMELTDRFPVSINLNYEDIRDPETRVFLDRLLRNRSPSVGLTFEILENTSIEDFEVVKEFLDHFRELGVRIAIDDFGSDYSNLLRILKLSPDYLKIDGSLIRDLAESREAYGAVRSIVAYARSLGIATVAEYVENDRIREICLELEIDYLQGYGLSEPFPAERLIHPA